MTISIYYCQLNSNRKILCIVDISLTRQTDRQRDTVYITLFITTSYPFYFYIVIIFIGLPLYCVGQDDVSRGTIAQLRKSWLGIALILLHSCLLSVSLISLHWLLDGWMKTPDPPHNPNSCRHTKATTFLLHSKLAPMLVSSVISCVALLSSFHIKKIFSASDGQLEEVGMFSSSVWQNDGMVLNTQGQQ